MNIKRFLTFAALTGVVVAQAQISQPEPIATGIDHEPIATHVDQEPLATGVKQTKNGETAVARVQVVVKNPSALQRNELVAVDAYAVRQRMGVEMNAPIRVRNAHGQLVTSQLTHDGLLLLETNIRPRGEALFTVEAGSPAPAQTYATGNLYSIRKDDIAWENDRGAYRVYGPALRKTGERAYGVDVWTKSTPRPVVARRYREDYLGNMKEDSLRRKGLRAESREVDMATSFHLDHGDGMDGYGVGPSLGCGAPALMKDGALLMPWCWQQYRILDNGPLRFTVELQFYPFDESNADKALSLGAGQTKANVQPLSFTEHRLISLDKGSNYNRCTVWYEGLQTSLPLAMGVVLHKEDMEEIALESDMVLYADPTDNPKKHNSQIYVGCLFPEGVSQTKSLLLPKAEGSIAGHAIGIADYKPDTRYTYYFGSAWSGADVRTFGEWKLRSEETLTALKQPLQVSLVNE